MNPLFELYKEWMKKGVMPANGLCNSIPYRYRRKLVLFYPTYGEWKDVPLLGVPRGYWGYDGEYDIMADRPRISKEFSPLRQTIVLLICAMCDEI